MAEGAAYNGDGARLKQVVNGVETAYTQDLAAPLPVVLQAKTGVTTTQYLFDVGTRPLAQYDSAWAYVLADGLGSVRQLTDAGGNVTLAEAYDPYGSVLNRQGSATSIFGYAGEQMDSTGLVFLRARYMRPGLGMFLSRDPLGASSPYRYASNNPINRVDPTGYIDWQACVNQGPYSICMSQAGDNVLSIATTFYTAGIGNTPGDAEAIKKIALAIMADNPHLQLGQGYRNGQGEIAIGTQLKLRSDWIAAVINGSHAPTPTPLPPPSAPPVETYGITGYLEGVGFSATDVACTLYIRGKEIVYDLVSKPPQRARFTYTNMPWPEGVWPGGLMREILGPNPPAGISLSAGDATVSAYHGVVWGFTPGEGGKGIGEYSGPFYTVSGGTGAPIPHIPLAFGGAGVSIFRSEDSSMWGLSAYVSGGAAIPIDSSINVSGAWTQYSPPQEKMPYYDISRLASDIRTGDGSPIPFFVVASPIIRFDASRLAQAVASQSYR